MKSIRYFLSLALLSTTSLYSLAQCDTVGLAPDSLQWIFAGGWPASFVSVEHHLVEAIEKYKDTLYVGGQFDYIGKYTGSFIGLNKNTGELVDQGTWPKSNKSVNAAISDGAGGMIIVGNFDKVGDSIRHGVARINASGQVTPFVANADLEVMSAVVNNNILYIGGYFNTVNGVNRKRLAAIDLTTGAVLPWSPTLGVIFGSSFHINCIATDGTDVFFGGEFETVNGTARTRIASVSISAGTLTSWYPATGTDIQVRTIKLRGNLVYIGGDFTTLGGVARNMIAAVNKTTAAVTAWNPDANNSVRVIEFAGSRAYVGGYFTSIGGQTRNAVAALDTATGMATAWNPNPTSLTLSSQYVKAIGISGTTAYIGGSFNTMGTQTRINFAAIDTGSGQPVNPLVNAYWYQNWSNDIVTYVNTIFISGNNMYIGGRFLSIGGYERKNLAGIDLVNNKVIALDKRFGGTIEHISDIKFDNNKMYVTGNYTAINNIGQTCITSLNMSNNYVVENWNPLQQYLFAMEHIKDVRAITFSGNYIYIGGRFSFTDKGITHYCVARFNRTTRVLDSWAPAIIPSSNPTIDYVDDIAIIDNGNKAVFGGSFGWNTANNNFNGNFAVYDFQTAATTYDDHDQAIACMTRGGEKLFVGGRYTKKGTTQRNRALAWDTSLTALSSWNPDITGADTYSVSEVAAIEYLEGKVFLGGNFKFVGGKARESFAAVNSTTGTPLQWRPSFNILASITGEPLAYQDKRVRKILAIGDTVFVGGDFNDVNGKGLAGLARFHPDFKTPTIAITGPPFASIGSVVNLSATVSNLAGAYNIEWWNNGVVFSNTSISTTSYTKTVYKDSIYAIVSKTGCDNKAISNSLIIYDDILSIKNLPTNGIEIYPNPFDNYVKVNGLDKGDNISLYDIIGTKIQSWKASGSKEEILNIPGYLSKGNYLLKITDKTGAQKGTAQLQK